MSQKELLIEKFEAYKKLYNESKDDFEPLRNNDDITFIENLIKTNNFAVVPVYKENKITKFYTVGLWYFFNVPELVINLENIVLDNENDEYINMIFDIIYRNIIKLTDFSTDKINISLEKYNLNYDLINVKPDDYLGLDSHFMFWFYMYYSSSLSDEIYKVLMLDLNENLFNDTKKKLLDFMLQDNDDEEILSDLSVSD